MSVAVLGNIHMNPVVPHLPVAGETPIGHTIFTAAGNKAIIGCRYNRCR